MDKIQNVYNKGEPEIQAVIEKEGMNFIGLCGIRRNNGYELVYRFMQKYWGKGYATEAAKATLIHAINHLHLSEVYALIDSSNIGSVYVAEKIGMQTTSNTQILLYKYQKDFLTDKNC